MLKLVLPESYDYLDRTCVKCAKLKLTYNILYTTYTYTIPLLMIGQS